MRGRKPDIGRARRLTGHRPVSAPLTPVSTDFGDVPDELTGAGRELWLDATAFLTANGRSNRVYRHSLRLLCRLFEDDAKDIGIARLDAIRRWMGELQLTPASSARGGGGEAKPETGPGRLRARPSETIARSRSLNLSKALCITSSGNSAAVHAAPFQRDEIIRTALRDTATGRASTVPDGAP